MSDPITRPTNQIAAIRENVITLAEQQKAILESQATLNRATGEILDILKGTLQTPGVLHRLLEVEKGLGELKNDLCAHVGEHKVSEAERAKQNLEDARDKKKRAWDRQDALTIAIVLMALSPFVTIILKFFGLEP